MRPIDRKGIVQAIKAGKSSVADAKVALSTVKSARASDIDEREPMERVADELSQFTAAIASMSAAQNESVLKILQLLISAVETIGKQKAEIKLDTSDDNRPTEWEVHADRDKNGFIKFPIKIKANA